MAKFLTREQLYRVIQRELPEDVYPDGAPDKFYSTADSDATADVVATGYANLERIYQNYFPQTADEYIDKWIDKMFIGVSFDASVSLQDKRDRVIAKVRKRPTLQLWEILKLLAGYVPPGTYVQAVEYNCGSGLNGGMWRLGVSRLGVDTMLGFDNIFEKLGVDAADWCDIVSNRGWRLGVSQLGVDTEINEFSYLEIIEPQIRAYGYEIRIFDYAVTGTSFAQMVRAINETEPARSVHQIRQNLALADFGLVNTVSDVDEFSLVNCITQDSTSLTGYSGRTD